MKRPSALGATQVALADVLADRGREALRAGRFKEAVEVFKQLVRQDKCPEWSRHLGDAYAGRARALADKGMFKEAAMVLENTLPFGATIREPVLYLTCLIRQGSYQKARQTALSCLSRPPPADADGVAGVAALLSLAVPAPGAPPGPGPDGDGWTKASEAARATLGAWLQGKQPEAVDRLLASIPLRSPFGPLRLILKSLTTPSDAASKARGLLAMVPAGSMFESIRAAAEATLADDAAELLAAWSRLRPAQRTFVAETRGLRSAGTALLDEILDAERRGPAALFSLLTKPGLALPEADLRGACLDLLPALPAHFQQFNRRFEPLTTDQRNRVLALAGEMRGDWQQAEEHWCNLAESLSHQSVPDARLKQAVVLRHLADLAQRHPDDFDDAWGDPVADYLERSLKADPDHLPATLALLDRCRKADSPKDWHQATEQAVRRFPGNAAVLLHAVDATVARSAYKKAAGFARRLLTLDPINQSARQRMIELQLAYARKQMRSGRADLAGKALSQAAEWERPDAPSAALRIGQALVTMQGDQSTELASGLRHAVQIAGGGTVGWFRAVLEAALMGWSEQRRQPLHRELAAAGAGEPSRELILSLIGMLGQKEIRDSKRVVASVLWRIEPLLAAGSGIAWSPAEFQTIAASLHELTAYDALRAYARDALRRDAGDPAARFYRIVAQVKGNRDHLIGAQEAELADLMDRAASRQDFHALNRVRRFLEGPDAILGGSRRLPFGAPPVPFDGEIMEELLSQALDGIAGLPRKEIRKLVGEFGRNRAIEMLADMVADTPLAEVMSDQQVARLCAVIVARASEGPQQQARR
jgi:cellulose synthase operon protein C